MRLAIATLAAGRADHLRRQATALARHGRGVERLVVCMDPESVRVPGARVVHLATDGGPPPLAAARNRALAELAGCDLVILLDVDCIPSARLVDRYRAAAGELGGRGALLCGPVGYLDQLPLGASGPDAAERRRARSRVIREFPVRSVRREPRAELFWSLSFAVAPATHAAIGGFDERYRGWGAEDTDYGLRASEAGVGLWLVGGAWAYHQPHPPAASASEVAALTANARRFRARWGFWPMPARLRALAREHRIDWDPDGELCQAGPGVSRADRECLPLPSRGILQSTTTKGPLMATIEESIDVEVPVSTAYNQWTQFESFPQFMDGVEEIRQSGERTLHWRASFGSTTHEWDAEITEQSPEERVAWRNVDGKENAGVVTFHKLAEDRTRVMVQMDWVPEGIKERIGDVLGAADRRVRGDLANFKQFIESRSEETGEWRGEVPRDG